MKCHKQNTPLKKYTNTRYTTHTHLHTQVQTLTHINKCLVKQCKNRLKKVTDFESSCASITVRIIATNRFMLWKWSSESKCTQQNLNTQVIYIYVYMCVIFVCMYSIYTSHLMAIGIVIWPLCVIVAGLLVSRVC